MPPDVDAGIAFLLCVLWNGLVFCALLNSCLFGCQLGLGPDQWCLVVPTVEIELMHSACTDLAHVIQAHLFFALPPHHF